MSYLNSTNIVIGSVIPTGFKNPKASTFANSPVLDVLLPQLSGLQTNGLKARQWLENVDGYMLEETAELLKRVSKFCEQLGLSNSTTFAIKQDKSALRIDGQFDEKSQFCGLVNQDRWIGAAFNWLYASYSALAHSQELLRFSYAYEKNRQQALSEYNHFERINQGMDCHLSCRIEEGKPSLAWCVESPLMHYYLKKTWLPEDRR